FAGGVEHSRMRIAFTHAAHATHDVFHHHNSIVDDETNGSGHAAKRHDVETHSQDVDQQNGGGHHGRHSQARDQRNFPVAQKHQYNAAGQHHTDQVCSAHAASRSDGAVPLVVAIAERHSLET